MSESQSLFMIAIFGAIGFAMQSSALAQKSSLEQAISEYSAAMEIKNRNERLQRFSRAEQLFRQAISGTEDVEPVRNVELYVNLGNAALQAEHVGAAIVSYRRALLIDPNHAVALQNLHYARSTLPDWVQPESSSGIVDTLFFWQSMYSRHTILTWCALCFLVAAALFAGGLVRGWPLLRNSAAVPLVVWLVLLLSTAFSASVPVDEEAVVTSDGCVLRSADSENSPPRLSSPIPDGTEVVVVQQRDRWVEVKIAGRSGWILKSNIQRLIES